MEQRRRAAAKRPPRDRPHRRQLLPPEPDVLGDRQVRDERELLEDRGDPGARRSAWAARVERLAEQSQLAVVGVQRAGEDLDEGALARAVLADQCVHFAARGLEVDVAERDDAAEALRHAARFEVGHRQSIPQRKLERTSGPESVTSTTFSVRAPVPVSGPP